MRRLVILLLLLLPALAPGPAAGGEKGFSGAVNAMRKGLRSSDLNERRLAVWELDGFDSAEAARVLCRRVLDRDDRAVVISAGIKLLGALESEEAVDAVIRESKVGRAIRRARVIEALGWIGGPRVEECLLTAAYNEDPLVRTSAVLALENLPTDRVEFVVSDALKSRFWTVRSAAIQVARRRGNKESIPGLIERLRPGAEDGRLVGDVTEALRHLTEQPYGASYESWRRWYEDMVGGTLPDAPVGVTGAPPKSRVEFASIKSMARRVVFVLAVHESMKDEFHQGGKWRIPRDVAEAGGAEIKEWEMAKTKLELAQLWLAWSIDHLTPEISFDVVTYGQGAGAAFGELVPATPANCRKAINRIQSLSPSGRANLYSGLKLAFTLVSKDPLDEKSLNEGPEAVIFISDGNCELGEIDQGYAVVDEVARLNLYRQIEFYVVSPGEGDARVLSQIGSIGPLGGTVSIP